MLKRLIALLTGQGSSKARAPSTRQASKLKLARLNALTPLKHTLQPPHTAAQPQNLAQAPQALPPSAVCREAVLNRAQKVAGYAFSLTYNVRRHSEVIQSLCDDMLLMNLLEMDIQRLLGKRLTFISLSPSALASPILKLLPKHGLVIVISNLSTLLSQADMHLAQCQALKQAGARIALQGDITQSGLAPFIALADDVLINIGDNDLLTIKAQVVAIQQQAQHASMVATNIRQLDEFNVCTMLPFDFFQGSFVSSMRTWTAPAMDVARLNILKLLNVVRQDDDDAALVQVFKQDPTLSFKLMRYCNSAGAGASTKVTGLEQALHFLGRQAIFRWLTMLLFTSGHGHPLDVALMENALVRARLAELCATASLPSHARDELFIACVFSLLDVLLCTPMEKILAEISLPPLVVEALLERTGTYAPYLALAIACEQDDHEVIATTAQTLGLTLKQVMAYQIEAVLWAESAYR
ncbi:MAG TPA: HDOD domain-containing protein [Methylophilus sp.]